VFKSRTDLEARIKELEANLESVNQNAANFYDYWQQERQSHGETRREINLLKRQQFIEETSSDDKKYENFLNIVKWPPEK
jgi:hypothetical protein